uniref:(northern house mosquito) hypothetical protein n=1 Tax=Culex pipiens TaxID=7175 RepID=A0A8D8AIU3_CULPI
MTQRTNCRQFVAGRAGHQRGGRTDQGPGRTGAKTLAGAFAARRGHLVAGVILLVPGRGNRGRAGVGARRQQRGAEQRRPAGTGHRDHGRRRATDATADAPDGHYGRARGPAGGGLAGDGRTCRYQGSVRVGRVH